VTKSGTVFSLRNNGKSDGSLNSAGGQPSGDEVTMALMGALPILMMPDARRAANIGFGTGLTAHALLASDRLESVDTIEIEPAVVRAARHFLPVNARAFDDPRSRVHIEDAKTFFSSHQIRYDVIVSEPSNPWVSGVAGLFSAEFYQHARRHLKEGGLFVQWVQLYEFSPQLLASAIEALRPAFSDYVVYLANDGDLILVAANGGKVPDLQPAALKNPAMAELLQRFNIRGLDDLYLHRVGSRRVMDAYFRAFGAEPNSDFFPIIDLNASKARFMKLRATGVVALTEAQLPLLDLFEPGYAPDPGVMTQGRRFGGSLRPLYIAHAATAREYLLSGDAASLKRLPNEPAAEMTMMRAVLVDCRVQLAPGLIRPVLDHVARLVNTYLPKERATEVWAKLRASPCSAKLSASDRAWIDLYSAIGARDAARIAQRASGILEREPDLAAESRAYALAAAMAGHILAGERGLAMKAFNQHRGKLQPAAAWQPVFTFLTAHALGPIIGEASSRVDN